MKTKENILFDYMEPDGEGGILPLTDSKILAAMQDYAEEVLTDYVLKTTRCGSRYEANRVAKIYFDQLI